MSFPTRRSDKDRLRAVSDVVGKRAIKKKVKRDTGEKMSAAEALEQSRRKPRLERATRDVVEYLSTSVVAICSLLDPEAILFGGGTSEAGAPGTDSPARSPAAPLARAPVLAGRGSDSQLYGALWGAAKAAHLPTPDARRATSANRSSEAQERAARLGGKPRVA